MRSRSARTRSSDSSDRPTRLRGHALSAAFLAASLAGMVLLAGCEGAVPFNVNLLALIPAGSASGLHDTDSGMVEVAPDGDAAPAFSLDQVPLNDVQIPFDPGPALDPHGITSARIELTLLIEPSPVADGVGLNMESDISIYVAPTGAEDRFAPSYRISLGRVPFGTSEPSALTGEFSETQMEYLKEGGLLLGLEFADTTASLHNAGETGYLFEGVAWELSELRILGTVAIARLSIAAGAGRPVT